MAVEIKIPEVGESVTSGVIAAWTKSDGDWVDQDDTVIELETDKITMEIPAPASGVLQRSASEGDEVEVGAVVGSIDESAERPASSEAGTSKQAQADGGGTATAAPPKAAATPKSTPTPQAQPAPSSNGSAGTTNGFAGATPLAKKLASDLGIDLTRVRGTGAGDKVREQDVIAFWQSGSGAAGAAAPAEAGPARAVRTERMSPLRRRVATRLVEAQQTTAMLTTFNEVDMGPVMALRKKHKDAFAEKHGVGLGFMSFFVKAACGALKAFPAVNASIIEQDGSPAVEYHDFCDVAIAVASPKGLVVPVVRNAETLSFAEIESTIKDFAVRAKDGKLSLEEMTGGTFTITNGGVFGSLMSTPILNPPQSAILGMHTIKKRPAEDLENPGQIALRPMMYLAVSYDHRIIDGAEAVSFLVHIKNAIEDPARLLIDL
ncbi:MAG: 2-oxoglutarate dehydrogenase complex dihydrolipoyllysine-residue succinyltransferase [Planctomycetota bacterium]